MTQGVLPVPGCGLTGGWPSGEPSGEPWVDLEVDEGGELGGAVAHIQPAPYPSMSTLSRSAQECASLVVLF